MGNKLIYQPLRVAIIGGGRRCNEMLEMVTLGEIEMELIGVADINPNAEGVKSARERGIYTTSNFKDLYGLEGLDLIIETTGVDEVYEEVNQTRPHNVQVIGYRGARLLWDAVYMQRKAKAGWETLTKSSPIGIYIYQDERFKFVNQKFAEMFGYTKEELIGMEVWKLVRPEEREMLKGRGEKRLKGEDIPSYYEYRGVTKDGTTIWVGVTATVIEYSKRPAVLVNVQDITERKQSEETLKRLTDELQKRVKELEDFHDIVVGRELEMARLEEENERLREEIEKLRGYLHG